MTSQEWTKLGLSGLVILALVGLALLVGRIPLLQNVYIQVSGSLLGVLGLHHGSDVLTQKLDAGAPPTAPVLDPVPNPVVVAAPTASGAVEVTPVLLLAAMPQAGAARCTAAAPLIQAAALKWEINTKERLAMWLGNCALECDQLREMAEEWVPTKEQIEYEPPAHVAKILGNTERGDGARFKGRGVIQLTGRCNYRMAGTAIGHDLLADPEAAAGSAAWDIAGWFWAKHGLNEIADTGDFQKSVQVINGGLTNLAERKWFYDRFIMALA